VQPVIVPEEMEFAAAREGVDAPLALALADALVALTASLSDLAYDLGCDAETLRRHMASLQAVDRITQEQLAIADVLRSRESMPERLAAVTLEDLADTLRSGYEMHRLQKSPYTESGSEGT
jgi:gamma-glutamyl:cysteine ligase YbdK (ATP-grasp superfamily)